MKLSIIIVNYCTPQLCIDCISSIKKYTKDIEYEIILVENGSNDGSYETLYKILPKDIKLIPSKDNLGFGRANNLGFEQAKGKYVLFLNSDTLVENNVICKMVTYLDNNPQVGCVGVRLCDENYKPVKSEGNFPTMMTSIRVALSKLRANILGINHQTKKNQKSIYIKQHQTEPYEVNYIMGADLMMRSSLFKNLNGFDKNIFMYFEESDLQLRANQKGWKQMIIPCEYIIHLEGKSMTESNFKRLIYNTSMMYFMKKHYNPISFFIFKISLYIIYKTNTKFDKHYTTKENQEFLKLFQIISRKNYYS